MTRIERAKRKIDLEDLHRYAIKAMREERKYLAALPTVRWEDIREIRIITDPAQLEGVETRKVRIVY